MYGIVRKYIGVILDTVKELMDMRGYKHMACGVRCVLSPRPSNCSTSSPHKDEKDRPHSTSARGQQLSRDCAKTESELKVLETYVGIKRTEKRERARSSVYRQRVPLDLTPRPSTAPLGMGRRAPETPMCEIIWRRKDDYKETSQHCTEDLSLTPTLHLYLPSSYQPHEQGEDGGAVEDNSDSKEQDTMVDLKEHDITMESQKQDVTINKTQDERQTEFTDVTQYDITDTGLNDKQKPEETFENDTMREIRQQDDNNQQEMHCHIERFFNIVDDKQEYDITEKTEGIFRRTKSNRSSFSRLTSKTRYPATATALTFPSILTDRYPSPTVSLLPSFYGTSFGYRIRTMSENSKTRTRKPRDDNRLAQSTNDMRHSIEIKGNPCLLKTRAGLAVGPHPEIMSIERGSRTRKMKTTKTFLSGPKGPQETKTVCEQHSPENRWRGQD
ncbi:uncharacterized protein isoform X2 [Danio rerio]|uniref:Uncharacterized protein isoform X2 n=1 Tax=Danio rerio TaxID=7955 RepID=A0AC58GBJ1_DANRE